MNLLNFLLLSLATWRIASLITHEKGPFGLLVRIRSFAGIVHDADGFPVQIPDGFLPELLSCVWCLSLWVGLAWSLFWYFLPSVSILIALPFALSAVAILIDNHVKG